MKTSEQASDTLIFYFLLFFLPTAWYAGMDSIPSLEGKDALKLPIYSGIKQLVIKRHRSGVNATRKFYWTSTYLCDHDAFIICLPPVLKVSFSLNASLVFLRENSCRGWILWPVKSQDSSLVGQLASSCTLMAFDGLRMTVLLDSGLWMVTRIWPVASGTMASMFTSVYNGGIEEVILVKAAKVTEER